MLSRRRSYFLPLMALLIALAWIILWTWEQSPYGRYINHGQFGAINQDSAICRVFDAGAFRDTVLPAMLFLLGWLLMCWAMMLPTTLPLLRSFRRLTSRGSDRNLLIVLVISGYMAVWLGFGIAAHALYSLIYWMIDDSLWLQINGWMLGVAVLLLAGGFQFSSLKSHCLAQCHAPQGFITRYRRDGAGPRHALRLGLRHGLYCVGCCWAMMSLMFVVGTGSVGWMLLLGVVMAVEKNLTWGRRLSVPLGVILVVWAGAIAAHQLGFVAI